MSVHHYLVLLPVRIEVSRTGGIRRAPVDCWLDRTWTECWMGCACGYLHRTVGEPDLGVSLSRCYGEMSISDDALASLASELDVAHAVQMVPAVGDLQWPVERPEVPLRLVPVQRRALAGGDDHAW